MNKTAVYIHIPFCDHKCIYCDFYSLVSYDNIDPYLTALVKEIEHYSKLYSSDRIIDTIFFGGGTPSFMTPAYIGRLIDAVDSNFNLSPDAEITLETNPGTVDLLKLKEYQNIGVNRISIGIQTFDEEELKFLTRIHDKKTAIQTVHDSAQAGFDNISIDLIFSLPDQSHSTWVKNLETAASLPIKHISAYSLILEKGTILNKMVLDGKIQMAGEHHDANLYKYTMDFLIQNGFIQYEVSNFAFENYQCRHNLHYWKHNDYLAFGTSAHSFANGKRWWNYSSLKKYILEINSHDNAVRGEEILQNSQLVDEAVMLGLRSSGVNIRKLNSYSKEWYIKKKNIINSFITDNLLVLEKDTIKCTPQGYLLCDEIINKLL